LKRCRQRAIQVFIGFDDRRQGIVGILQGLVYRLALGDQLGDQGQVTV